MQEGGVSPVTDKLWQTQLKHHCPPYLAARVSPLSVDESLSKLPALSLAPEELLGGEPAAALRAAARPWSCNARARADQGGVVGAERDAMRWQTAAAALTRGFLAGLAGW